MGWFAKKGEGFQADGWVSQMGVNPDKPFLMVLEQLSPSLTLWPQRSDVGAGMVWGSSASAWHGTHHGLCPALPQMGQGHLQQATFGDPACGC